MKKNAVTQLFIVLGIAVVINIMAAFLYTRLDLTNEKRYTLSQNTKQLVKKLDDVLFIKVYLSGEDLPNELKKLSQSIEDLLNELRLASGNNIEYEFINPSQNKDQTATEDFFKELYQKGLEPNDVSIRENDGMKRKVIFPGALMYYKGKEVAVNFLKSKGSDLQNEQLINHSEEGLEYEIANALKKIISTDKPKIAFISGNRQLNKKETFDMAYILAEYYDVSMYDIAKIEAIPSEFKTIVIAKPDSTFSEWHKFKIDHYLMNGGRILWCIDQLTAEMDSMKPADAAFMAYAKDLNIDDQLFKYGIRINPYLVQDLKSSKIPVTIGNMGGRPQIELFSWFYFPIIAPTSKHPIVKNIDPIRLEFANTIDLIETNANTRATVLLQTSPQTKVLFAPVRVNLGLVKDPPNVSQFDGGSQNVAVLVEGSFTSLYKNRAMGSSAQKALDSLGIKTLENSKPTKMIVVADGDILKNYTSKANKVYPVGYDRFTKRLYGNKTFIQNAIDYLCDDTGLIAIRAKEITLRLLDKQKIKTNKIRYQVLNMGLPIVLLLLFGLIYNYRRKKQFTRR